jgi:hypothetical protein
MTGANLNERASKPNKQALIRRDLVTLLAKKAVGQCAATSAIIPYLYMYQSRLAAEGLPAASCCRSNAMQSWPVCGEVGIQSGSNDSRVAKF